jgi:hypothetical protein
MQATNSVANTTTEKTPAPAKASGAVSDGIKPTTDRPRAVKKGPRQPPAPAKMPVSRYVSIPCPILYPTH